jgi:hypothetical protein
VAIVCLGSTTRTLPQSTLMPGTAGAGGGGAIPGAPGLAVPAIDCSTF